MSISNFGSLKQRPLGVFVTAITLSALEYSLFGRVGFFSTIAWVIVVGKAAGYVADVMGLKSPTIVPASEVQDSESKSPTTVELVPALF